MLVIIDNLELFAEKLLMRLADDSNQGTAAYLAAFSTAQKRYEKPIESWFSGWIYSYTRQRGSAIDNSKKIITACPGTLTRMSELKILVQQTEREWGAFNFYLFDELIRRVPGYYLLSNEEVMPVFQRLREILFKKIDYFIEECKNNMQLVENRKIELQKRQLEEQVFIANVHLVDDVSVVVLESLKNHPEQTTFCLHIKNGAWQLIWIDFMGKNRILSLTDELNSLLVAKRVTRITDLKEEHYKAVITQCMKAKELFTKQTHVLIDPQDPVHHIPLSNVDLTRDGTKATFVLRSNPYTLCWVDMMGKVKELSLTDYPDLMLWLESQSLISESNIELLKVYLLHINTCKSIVIEPNLQHALNSMLRRQRVDQQQDEVQLSEAELPKQLQKPIERGTRLNLSLFSNVQTMLNQHHGGLKDESNTNTP